MAASRSSKLASGPSGAGPFYSNSTESTASTGVPAAPNPSTSKRSLSDQMEGEEPGSSVRAAAAAAVLATALTQSRQQQNKDNKQNSLQSNQLAHSTATSESQTSKSNSQPSNTDSQPSSSLSTASNTGSQASRLRSNTSGSHTSDSGSSKVSDSQLSKSGSDAANSASPASGSKTFGSQASESGSQASNSVSQASASRMKESISSEVSGEDESKSVPGSNSANSSGYSKTSSALVSNSANGTSESVSTSGTSSTRNSASGSSGTGSECSSANTKSLRTGISGTYSSDTNAIKEEEQSNGGLSESESSGTHIFFVRNAERMDRIFPDFVDKYFNEQDQYVPADLNMPLKLPGRVEGRKDFVKDAPITEMGQLTSQMLGRGFQRYRVHIGAVFVSPALRCVQTAAAIMKLTEQTKNTLLKIEPALYESSFAPDGLPNFLTPEQLKQAGFPIDLNYRPYRSVTTIQHTNTRQRLADVIEHIIEYYSDLGDIVVVGHSMTTDSCARHLLKKTAGVLRPGDKARLGVHYPYCSAVALQQNPNNEWSMSENALPSISYQDFTNRVNADFLLR